jgi:hypothetical protein
VDISSWTGDISRGLFTVMEYTKVSQVLWKEQLANGTIFLFMRLVW